jgi:hypothetical protein
VTDFFWSAEGRRDYVAVAGMALGYMSNRTQNRRALDFLMTMIESRDYSTLEGGVVGLGLSGDPSARAALQRLRDRLTTQNEWDKELRAALLANVDQALRDNAQIHDKGLEGYYSGAAREPSLRPAPSHQLTH